MSKEISLLITGYIVIMSLLGFILMGVDKERAKRKAYRIPERTLFVVAFLGGGIGSYVGMYGFRHKTKHTKFLLLIPLAAILYLLVILKIYNFI